MKMLVIFIYILLFNEPFTTDVYGQVGVTLKKAQSCDFHSNYTAMLNSTIKTIDKKQYVDGIFKIQLPLDNRMRTKVEVKMITGKNSVHLLDINERKSCDAVHKYMGEFVYDLERKVGLIPGMCPIPKGKYEVHDVLLDFNKFTTINNFPFGHLELTAWTYDEANKLLSCIVAEAEHRF